MQLSIIIVSYNTKDLLRNCLNSVFSNTKGIDFEVIVVDNASRDGSVSMLRDNFPKVIVVANKDNLGFAKANNQAIRVANGGIFFFLNPDTLVLGDAVRVLYDFLSISTEIGFIGPRLYRNTNREFYPTMHKFHSPLTLLLMHLPFMKYIFLFYNSYICRHSKIHYVDWLCGAALMVRKDVLDVVGLFDESFFLYSEEQDLCWRMHISGYKVCYYPKAEIVHLHGKSSEQSASASVAYYWNSKLVFLKKYYPFWQIRLFKKLYVLLMKAKIFFRIIPKNEYYNFLIKTVEDWIV